MEAMLQRLRGTGLVDVAFVVVNSRDLLAHLMIRDLKKRVSFPVYQDTHEEEVWAALEGGKDDVLIYDKCGRLAYFIPFPLSLILTNRSMVEGAILATYYEEPCGPCNDTSISALDDFSDADPSLENSNATDSGFFYWKVNSTGDAGAGQEQTDEGSGEPGEFQVIHMEVVDMTLENPYIPSLNLSNDVDPIEINRTDESNAVAPPVTSDGIESTNKAKKDNLQDVDSKLDSSSEEDESKEESASNVGNHGDHCSEFGGDACQDWSVDSLNRARRCCQMGLGDKAKSGGLDCSEFGRKRCKKILPLVKCCLQRDLQAGKETTNQREAKKCETTGDQPPCQVGYRTL